MSPKQPYKKQPRRRRAGKTDYKKRLAMLKSRQPRLVVRVANRHITAQIIDYSENGDRVLASAVSKDLAKFGWKYSTSSIPAAYLTGLLCAKKAKSGQKAVFDMGMREPLRGTNTYSALKGAVDGGVQIPCDEGVFPPEERVNGTHIANYASLLKKGDEAAFKKQFSKYIKDKLDPTKMPGEFEKVKKGILSGGKK
jgi:large subunit ribosomal protein L18